MYYILHGNYQWLKWKCVFFLGGDSGRGTKGAKNEAPLGDAKGSEGAS